MSLKPNVYPLGTTDEFIPVEVVVMGTLLEFSVNPIGTRPVSYTPAIYVAGEPGFIYDATAWGTFRIFARWDNGPVVDCGIFVVA